MEAVVDMAAAGFLEAAFHMVVVAADLTEAAVSQVAEVATVGAEVVADIAENAFASLTGPNRPRPRSMPRVQDITASLRLVCCL